MDYFAHESALIDEGAQIGAETKVWHWVHVCSGAILGKKCVLGQNVFVGNRVVLGDNVKVQNNVSIYDNVTLEDDVFCGPSMVFTNVYNPRSYITRLVCVHYDSLLRNVAGCLDTCGISKALSFSFYIKFVIMLHRCMSAMY